MLPEHDRRLVTAYVDGELSDRERRAAERLLRRSAEAQGLFRRLRQDSRALRALPRPHLPADVSESVVGAIRSQGLKPRRPPGPSSRPVFSLWSAAAVAAAVLVAVGYGSYLYFADPRASEEIVVAPPAPRPNPEADKKEPDGGADEGKEPFPPGEPEPREKDPPEGEPHYRIVEEVPAASAPKVPDKPDPREPVVKGADDKDPQTKLERVKDPAPVVLPFLELNKGDVRDRLRKGLVADSLHLELLCRDSNKALGRLRPALKARGLDVLVDVTAQGLLRGKPALKADYAVYVENLTRKDLALLLQEASAADRKVRQAKERGFTNTLVVAPLSELDRKNLRNLIGVDPLANPPARPKGPLGTDVSTRLEERTSEQVALILEGKPGARRNDAKPSPNKALVLPYGPVWPRPGSDAVKKFQAGRGDALAGTVRVLLVLRHQPN